MWAKKICLISGVAFVVSFLVVKKLCSERTFQSLVVQYGFSKKAAETWIDKISKREVLYSL